ncbi:hypothetical protein [Microbacterium sp.]|jgi:hypothetical protein|uniref:hypothetical protein n=1 Tax=Microbacterium sp. TaxID=51671 RepID=UPI002BA311FF|nr:hypothetical protein [Microbacterium sp.]HWL79100.1 hypothetical protein [Microbacterium sp.]
MATEQEPRPPERPAGPALMHLFEQELAAADTAREALQARASTVITTSVALATLFLAFGGLVQGPEDPLPSVALALLVAAAATLLASSLTAFRLQAFRRLPRLSDETLTLYTHPELPAASALDLETRILPTLAVRIRSARELNERLHALLLRALALEVAGVVLAATGAVVLLAVATDAASAAWPLIAGLVVSAAVVFAVLVWRGRPLAAP